MAPAASPASVPALKEWAAIVHAILAGEQIIDLRKGGLKEAGRHFAVPATRAWLYPTAEHQRSELLSPAYSRFVELADAAPVGTPIRLSGFIDVVGTALLTEPEQLAALTGKVIWTADYAEQRLKWKRRDPLWVLAVRAHRLDAPITVEWSADYGGCTSWVTLAGLPDPASVASQPVLSDEAFEARLRGTREALAAVGVELTDPR